MQRVYDEINDWLPPSLQRELVDRSMALGASKAGDFFQFTPERVEALRRGRGRRKIKVK